MKAYYGDHNNELQLPMDLMFAEVNKLSAPEFRRQIALVESSGGWPAYVISNHDIVRSYNRYGDGQHNDAIAKLMAGLYLTLRGTPIMYYGEEIGMENNDPKAREDVKDPSANWAGPKKKAATASALPCSGMTRPMRVSRRAPRGLPVPDSYRTHNVASESKDPNSILSFYRRCWRCGTPTRRCWTAITSRSTGRSQRDVVSCGDTKIRRYWWC